MRESIIFSNHRFIKDPPFSRLELFSCRNVMIYLGQDLQHQKLHAGVGDVFRLIASDVGPPITDLAARFPNPDLAKDIGEVLKTLAPCERSSLIKP